MKYRPLFRLPPLLVDETLYYCTPFNRVFALNPETGQEKWIFDPEVDPAGRPLKTCRGLSSWKDLNKKPSGCLLSSYRWNNNGC